MPGELSWSLPWRVLDPTPIRAAAQQVADRFGAQVEVELEEPDCVSVFFTVSAEWVAQVSGDGADAPDPATLRPDTLATVLELSLYELDDDGCVLCVEPEWSDNSRAWDAACELGEAFAELTDAEPLDLD